MRAPTGDGLQTARTALAWRRTVASAGAVGALIAHHALGHGHGWTAALLLVGAVIAPLGLAIAARVRRHHGLATPRLVGFAAAVAAVLAVLSLVAV